MLTMDDVRDEIRNWLSLRQWSINIERNGTGYNVAASEYPMDRKTLVRRYKHRPPLRTFTFHASDTADVLAAVEKNGAQRTCTCGSNARLTDYAMAGADESFACTRCTRRWPA